MMRSEPVPGHRMRIRKATRFGLKIGKLPDIMNDLIKDSAYDQELSPFPGSSEAMQLSLVESVSDDFQKTDLMAV